MTDSLSIALIQSPLIWENPEMNRRYFSKKIEVLAGDIELVVLPEMFNTGFTMHPENVAGAEGPKTLSWMQDQAVGKNIALMGSIPYHENGHYTNRLFFVFPDGSYRHYDKRHTFTLVGEDKVYRAGTEKLIIEFKGFVLCPLICYDLRFPVWSRNTEDYDVLLYVANWPMTRILAWDTLLKARAIENMSYCIGLNRVGEDAAGYKYNGHSAVYDALGQTLAFSDQEEILLARLDMGHLRATREKLKFLKDKDQFSFQ